MHTQLSRTRMETLVVKTLEKFKSDSSRRDTELRESCDAVMSESDQRARWLRNTLLYLRATRGTACAVTRLLVYETRGQQSHSYAPFVAHSAEAIREIHAVRGP